VGGVHESSGGSLGWPLSRVRALLPETSMDSAATIRRLAAHVSLRVDDAVVVVPRRRGRRDGPRASHARWAAYSCHHGAWATERCSLSEFPPADPSTEHTITVEEPPADASGGTQLPLT
jgi:hypothetical protein